MSGPAWMADRVCTLEEVDPEVFFPVGIGQEAQLLIEYAKEFCNRCPVRAECEDYALTIGADFGIWGGKTEEERAQDAKRRAGFKSTKPPREYHNCGTYSGVSRHRKAGEWLCDPCMGARREYEKKVRARRRDQEKESA